MCRCCEYLAEQSRRSLVLAVEEPEAFLHPAGQEAIKGQLDDLAARPEVSLLVTTHSPYVISRSSEALVTELRKDTDGVTAKVAAVAGDQSRASLLGALYRDAGLAFRARAEPRSPSRDEAGGRDRGVHRRAVHPTRLPRRGSGGATGRAFTSSTRERLRTSSRRRCLPRLRQICPVIALLDYDDNGRAAVDKLKSFNWEPAKTHPVAVGLARQMRNA